MRRVLAFVAVALAISFTVAAKPADFCARHPGHPGCGPAWTPPPATAVPTAGIPALPVQVAGEWRKSFADGTLGDFRVLTFPDDHLGQPGQDWTVYNRFRHTRQPTIHDGYLDVRATKRPDGLWDADLLGTSQDGSGRTFGYGRYEFASRANVGRATWIGMWLGDTTTWSVVELDWETLEAQQLSAHVHGSGAGSWYGAPPADWTTAWHVFSIDRRSGYVAFGRDGVEKARMTGSMPATPLAIMLDAKIGFPWAEGPDATTPDPTWLQVAWVRWLP